MDIQKLKKLLNRQMICLLSALAPIGTIAFATGLFSWVWLLFVLGIGLLLLEKSLLSHWSAQEIGDPRAQKVSSLKKRRWAKFFWFINLLFLFGGWKILSLEYLIISLYLLGYICFQYWGYKFVFKGK